MKNKLTPDYLVDKIENIKLNFLKEKGVRGLIIDLDNTMTFYNSREITDNVRQWLDQVREQGIKVVILSNNNARRIAETIDDLDIPYVEKARKPFKKGYLKAIKIMDLPKEQVMMIGDQIFTDTFGAKRTEIPVILVNPLPGREFWFTYISRFVERRTKKNIIKNVPWLE